MRFHTAFAFLSLVIISLNISSRALALPDITVRSSNMNRDISMSQTLFNALASSATSVPLISVTTRPDGEKVVTLASGADTLECTQASCSLKWDNLSTNSVQSSTAFENSLFESLYRWALGDGKNDPALRFVKYPTGNISIKVTEDTSSQDKINCIELDPSGAGEVKQCSFAVTDIESGNAPELKQKYADLLGGKSLIEAQKQAMLASVSSGDFLHEGNTENGNGIYTVEHTLYTDILSDVYSASLNYGYKAPIKDASGTIISHGINIKATGQQSLSGALVLQSVNAHSYVLAHRPRL